MKIIIAEKPSVARDIAQVLKATQKHNGYLANKDYAVTWALGHLVELQPPDAYDARYQQWTVDDLPIIPDSFLKQVTPNQGASKQFATIQQLLNHPSASEVICATDAGREGELIFRYIYEQAHCSLPIKRLWISSQTDQAIEQGLAQLRSGEDFEPLFHSAICRSEADWLIGMNASRIYTLNYSNGSGVMSVGRVQTPVLKMIVDRYWDIVHFTPQDYYTLQAFIHHAQGDYVGKWFNKDLDKEQQDRFNSKEDAAQAARLIAQTPQGHVLSTSQKTKKENPPLLFDLTELQKEANKKFKFSADKTLKIAQSLYEKYKIISYPRTSSRYLSTDLKPKIPLFLNHLAQIPAYQSFAEELLKEPLKFNKRIVDDTKITDHHAIVLTDKKPNLSQLSADEQSIFDLIAKRLLAVFMPVCEKAHSEIISQFGEHTFRTAGTIIKKAGWRAIYLSEPEPSSPEDADKEEERLLPPVQKADAIQLEKVDLDTKTTKAPAYYNEASILAAMETASKQIDDEELREAMKDCGLGTPATRAQILERLIAVGYIQREKNKLIPTDKGLYLIESIQDQELLSPQLTGEWEQKLNHIAQKKYSREQYMKEIKEFTEKIVHKAKNDPKSSLEPCPLCQNPLQENARAFSCSNWKNGCKFSIWKTIAQKRLKASQVNQLLKEKKTDVITGFKSKKGSSFDAALKLTEDFKVEFDFNQSLPSIGTCPLCGGQIIKGRKAYGCSNWKEKDCKFTIWQEIAHKKISEAIVQELLKNKQTKLLDGFKSKSGNAFKASLHLSDEGAIDLQFAANDAPGT